jgi:hypothetical protein
MKSAEIEFPRTKKRQGFVRNSNRNSSIPMRHADRRGWREGVRGLHVTAPNVVLRRQVEEGDKTSVRRSVCAGQSICNPKRSPLSVDRASHDVRRQTNRSPIGFRFRSIIELRPQRARLTQFAQMAQSSRRMLRPSARTEPAASFRNVQP